MATTPKAKTKNKSSKEGVPIITNKEVTQALSDIKEGKNLRRFASSRDLVNSLEKDV